MKNRNPIYAAFLLCVLVLATVQAAAQTSDDITRLQSEIERNERLLFEARELVSQTSSIKARMSFEAAARLHAQAKEYFQAGPGGGNLLRASDLTRRAREAILQTIALAKREARLEENAGKAIEQAVGRLEHARRLLDDAGPGVQTAARLISEASQQLERARDNMREHLFEAALRLALSSSELSNRASSLLRNDRADPDRVGRELEKTERVLERLHERLDGATPPPVVRMAREAQGIQQEARSRFSSGRMRLALEATLRARDLAARAMRILSVGTNPENVAEAIALTDDLIEEARTMAAEQDTPAMRERVERAADVQRDARDQLAKGNYESALRMTLRARDMLRSAMSDIRGDIDAAQVRAALTQTDALLERVGHRLADSRNDLAADLYARAKEKQRSAWQALQSERLRMALANTRLARRLAHQALQRLEDADSGS